MQRKFRRIKKGEENVDKLKKKPEALNESIGNLNKLSSIERGPKSEQMKNLNSQLKDVNKRIGNFENAAREQKKLTLQLMLSYLPSDYLEKFKSEENARKKDKEENNSKETNPHYRSRIPRDSLNTVLKLMNEGTAMIMNQEVKDSESSDQTRVLPKYTTEKMLLAHFLMYKDSQEEIKDFYNFVSIGLKDKISSGDNELKNVLEVLDNRKKFVEVLKVKEASPYKAKAPGVGQAYTVSLQGKQITFNSKAKFADYADTAVRNVVNLLCYNSAEKWGRLIKDD